MSEHLIARLAQDLRPVSPHAMSLRLTAFIVVGLVAAFALMLTWLGLRPDLREAVATPIYWTKFAYPLALAILGYVAIRRLARPGGDGRSALAAMAVIAGALGIAALIDYSMSPAAMRPRLVFGSSAWLCPFLILALSTPIGIATLACLRGLAPTNLTLAGAGAGLFAGALAAWVYAFHCTENGLPFLAIWYTLGMSLPALIGAAFGRVVLRW